MYTVEAKKSTASAHCEDGRLQLAMNELPATSPLAVGVYIDNWVFKLIKKEAVCGEFLLLFLIYSIKNTGICLYFNNIH